MENKQQPVVNICGSCILRDRSIIRAYTAKKKMAVTASIGM